MPASTARVAPRLVGVSWFAILLMDVFAQVPRGRRCSFGPLYLASASARVAAGASHNVDYGSNESNDF